MRFGWISHIVILLSNNKWLMCSFHGYNKNRMIDNKKTQPPLIK